MKLSHKKAAYIVLALVMIFGIMPNRFIVAAQPPNSNPAMFEATASNDKTFYFSGTFTPNATIQANATVEGEDTAIVLIGLYNPSGMLIAVSANHSEEIIPIPGSSEVHTRYTASLNLPDNVAGLDAKGFLFDKNTFVPLAQSIAINEQMHGHGPNNKPIDLGQLEELIEGNYIEVLQNDDSTIRVMDGSFTTITVTDIDDSLLVFNQVAPLLGIKNRPNFQADNITVSYAGEGDFKETFYRLNPMRNSIPVYGSDIILVVNKNGAVTGLFTTYDNRINSVNTTPAIMNLDAEEVAISALKLSLAEKYIEFDTSIPYDPRDYLNVESKLIIDNQDSNVSPILAWLVNIYNKDTSDTYPLNTVTEDDPVGFPYVNMSYYIYANGTSVGTLFDELSNEKEAWSNTTATADDLLARLSQLA